MTSEFRWLLAGLALSFSFSMQIANSADLAEMQLIGALPATKDSANNCLLAVGAAGDVVSVNASSVEKRVTYFGRITCGRPIPNTAQFQGTAQDPLDIQIQPQSVSGSGTARLVAVNRITGQSRVIGTASDVLNGNDWSVAKGDYRAPVVVGGGVGSGAGEIYRVEYSASLKLKTGSWIAFASTAGGGGPVLPPSLATCGQDGVCPAEGQCVTVSAGIADCKLVSPYFYISPNPGQPADR